MADTFAYEGHEGLGVIIGQALEIAGWTRVDDVVDADVVLTYFTNSTAVEDAYFETDGLIKRALPNTLLIDLSPTTPSFARELAAMSTVNDLRFAEAPLIVRDPSAAHPFDSYNLKCLMAGDNEAILNEAGEVLDAIADDVVRVGIAGRAQLARATCTSQIASQVLAAVEASSLYHAFSEPEETIVVFEGLDVATGMLSAIAGGRFTGDYTIEMMMGEVTAAIASAEDADLILPQLETAMHLLELLAVIGGSDMAPAALALVYREEQASADAGLDWTRAEGLFESSGHEHDHAHDLGYADAPGYYEDDDPYGLAGGFGGYSAN